MDDRDGAPARARAERFPELCTENAALVLVLGTELVVIALALFGSTKVGEFWIRLAWLSLFAQWVTLLSALLLCSIRRLLQRLRPTIANAVAIAVPIGVAVLVSEVAWILLLRHELELGLEVVDHGAYLARNAGLAALVAFVVLRYLALQQRWRDEVEAEARARIDALAARINPHFLFNTLNTAMALVHARPERTERMLGDLADLFRVALKDARTLAPLEQEFELTRAYLAIEEQRIGDRLRVAWDVDALPGDALVPRLMLQPLVENSVFHGIEPLAEGGEVGISGGRDGDRLWLAVTNPVASGPGAGSRSGGRMALDNVGQRVGLAFGERGSCTVEAGAGRFTVTVRFPYLKGPPAP